MLREPTTVTAGTLPMPRFRSRLRQLMLERSMKDGKQLSQTEVAEQARVAYATIQRWYKPDYTFDRVDADTLYGLRDFFKCSFDDLIERVD